MKKTTKRRKVWVNEYAGELFLLSTKLTKAEATASRGGKGRTVPFGEARPGDVVLSREDQLRVANEVAQSLVDDGWDSEDAPTIVSFVLAALRGGRRAGRGDRCREGRPHEGRSAMTGGRCVKHDNWHAECRRCLEDAEYARGVADERARVVAWLKDKSSEKRRNDWYTRMCAGEEIQRGEHEREAT